MHFWGPREPDASWWNRMKKQWLTRNQKTFGDKDVHIENGLWEDRRRSEQRVWIYSTVWHFKWAGGSLEGEGRNQTLLKKMAGEESLIDLGVLPSHSNMENWTGAVTLCAWRQPEGVFILNMAEVIKQSVSDVCSLRKNILHLFL